MNTPLEEYPDWLFKPHIKSVPKLMAILSEERLEDRKKLLDLIHKNISSYNTFLNEQGYSRLPFLIDDIIDYFRSKVSTKYFGLSRNARVALLREKGFKCCYCRRKLTLKTMTVEHIEPRSFGGSDEKDNLDIRVLNAMRREETN